MNNRTRHGIFASTSILSLFCLGMAPAAAQDAAPAAGSSGEGDIVVTARGREESLQDIPESISAFSAQAIEDRGISDFKDIVNQTPNFFTRESYRGGVTLITIRGISTGQQGWPPITYIVDGVKAATLDSINQGALFDLERVEVLKGPQGGLYGAGSIAGAVNVITKRPGNEPAANMMASFGTGNDVTVNASVSGPLVADKILVKLSGYYRNTDGLIDSQQGDDLDFERQGSLRGRVILMPSEGLSIDLRAAYTDILSGAAYQARIPATVSINSFGRDLDPERGIIGEETRRFVDLSAKIDLELPFATLTATSGYLKLDQHLYGSASFTARPALGQPPVIGFVGPIYGPNALPASDPAAPSQPFDAFQRLFSNFKIFTQDVRLTSDQNQRLRWVVGTEFIRRRAVEGLNVGLLLGTAGEQEFPFVARLDEKSDDIWGVYAQLDFDVTDRLGLTASGRYDQNKYDTTQFDLATGNLVPQIDENGNPVRSLDKKDSDFQPKVTLSYDWSNDFMTYATYAHGFRFGFFNTGALTKAETSENFELGFRSNLLGKSLTLNGSAFYVKYSNQQISQSIPTPPFRITTNVPTTNIHGVEFDFNWNISSVLQLNGGLGYLDAQIANGGGPSPATPKWTANFGGQITQPVTRDADFFARFDYRYQGEHISVDGAGNVFPITDVHLIDLRAGIRSADWSIVGFVTNAANERFAIEPSDGGGGFNQRFFNRPRAYGVQMSWSF